MILPQFLSLRFLCLFPCLNLCLSKGMWRCGCVVLISSGQGAVMGGREEPERVMERGVVRHTELRPHPLKKVSKLSKTLSVKNCKKRQNPKQVIQIWKYCINSEPIFKQPSISVCKYYYLSKSVMYTMVSDIVNLCDVRGNECDQMNNWTSSKSYLSKLKYLNIVWFPEVHVWFGGVN